MYLLSVNRILPLLCYLVCFSVFCGGGFDLLVSCRFGIWLLGVVLYFVFLSFIPYLSLPCVLYPFLSSLNSYLPFFSHLPFIPISTAYVLFLFFKATSNNVSCTITMWNLMATLIMLYLWKQISWAIMTLVLLYWQTGNVKNIHNIFFL